MKQKTRRHWSMGLRYRTACCGKFAAACHASCKRHMELAKLLGSISAVPRGTVRCLNATLLSGRFKDIDGDPAFAPNL
jgi:hypothetical protein